MTRAAGGSESEETTQGTRRARTLRPRAARGGRRWPAFAIAVPVILWLLSGAAFAQADIEACFVARANADRADQGLGALAVNQDLVGMARRQSQRMADAGTIFHNENLTGEAPAGWRLLGENVGVGPSCDSLHQAFMNSPHHRANILEARFNFVGTGVVVKGTSVYITEVFMQAGAVVTPPPPPPPAPSPSPRPSPSPKPPPSPKPSPPPAPSPPPSPSPEPPPPVLSPSPVASPAASPAVSPAASPAATGAPGPPAALLAVLVLAILAGGALAWLVTNRRRR